MTQHISSLTTFLIINLLMLGCTNPQPANDQNNKQTEVTDFDKKDTPRIATSSQTATPKCEINGEVLERNQYWEREKDLLVIIKADSSTTTEEYGPSHCILEVLNAKNCESLFKTTLTENTSPDYPYHLAPIQYNKVSNLVGIQGYYDVYVLELANNYKLSKLSPKFFTERKYDDPQSGMIQRLEVWEHYLIGHGQDVGTFAFDLNEQDNPKPVLPFAEWRDEQSGSYHALFLLPAEGGYQGIMPAYGDETGEFNLNPVFTAPQKVALNTSKSLRNNRFLVLRSTEEEKIYPIDLAKQEVLRNLPANVLSQSDKQIVKWLESQEQ